MKLYGVNTNDLGTHDHNNNCQAQRIKTIHQVAIQKGFIDQAYRQNSS